MSKQRKLSNSYWTNDAEDYLKKFCVLVVYVDEMHLTRSDEASISIAKSYLHQHFVT